MLYLGLHSIVDPHSWPSQQLEALGVRDLWRRSYQSRGTTPWKLSCTCHEVSWSYGKVKPQELGFQGTNMRCNLRGIRIGTPGIDDWWWFCRSCMIFIAMTLSKGGAYQFPVAADLLRTFYCGRKWPIQPHSNWLVKSFSTRSSRHSLTTLTHFPRNTHHWYKSVHPSWKLHFISCLPKLIRIPQSPAVLVSRFFPLRFSSRPRCIEAGVDHYGSEMELVGRRLDFWSRGKHTSWACVVVLNPEMK